MAQPHSATVVERDILTRTVGGGKPVFLTYNSENCQLRASELSGSVTVGILHYEKGQKIDNSRTRGAEFQQE